MKDSNDRIMKTKGATLKLDNFFFMLKAMKLTIVSTSRTMVKGSAAKRLLHTTNGMRKGCRKSSFLSSSMNVSSC